MRASSFYQLRYLVFFWILISLTAAAQAQKQTDNVAALPKVSSGTLQRLDSIPSRYVPARLVDVWIPRGIKPQQKLAVLYMHDGQMLFDAKVTWNHQEWRVDEVAQALIDAGKVQPFMVVGVHNGDLNRHAEYFPQQAFSALPVSTQQQFYQLNRDPERKLFSQAVYSDRYLKFLVEELKPYIDRHFPVYTDKEHTFIMGSSMGGLISMYALSEYPQIFGGAACLSTHWPGVFQTDHNPVPATFFSYMRQHLPKANSRKLYFDYGDQTLDAWYPPLQRQADQLLTELGWQAPMWQTRFFKGHSHSEADWAKRLDVPLQFLLGNASTP